MELDRDKIVLVFVSLVVIASGCVDSEDTSQATTASVDVLNFTAYPSQAYNNQQVRITLQLKNNGEQTAENVAAMLFNVPFTGENNWEFTSGDSSSRWKDFRTLDEAEPENNLPARPHTETWSLQAPNLDNGVTVPYNFMTRVFYKYTNRGSSEIVLMSRDRFRETGKRGRPALENTNGPIQMEIRTETPLVFYQQDGGQRETEMCIIVRNQGSGTPFLFQEGETYNPGATQKYTVNRSEHVNKVNLTIQEQGRINFVASGKSSDSDNPNSAVVDLIGSRGIQCFTLTASNWGATSGPQETVPITLHADYGYYRETQTSVTVEGNQRFGN